MQKTHGRTQNWNQDKGVGLVVQTWSPDLGLNSALINHSAESSGVSHILCEEDIKFDGHSKALNFLGRVLVRLVFLLNINGPACWLLRCWIWKEMSSIPVSAILGSWVFFQVEAPGLILFWYIISQETGNKQSSIRRAKWIFKGSHKLLSSKLADDIPLKRYFSSLGTTTCVSSSTDTTCSTKLPRELYQPKLHSSNLLGELALQKLRLDKTAASYPEESRRQLSSEISAILLGGTNYDYYVSYFSKENDGSLHSKGNNKEKLDMYMDAPWFGGMIDSNISLHRKEISREKKQKWAYKGSQTTRFERLVDMCAEKLGQDTTIQLFGRLGRKTGPKEIDEYLKLCIDKARKAEDEEVSLRQIYKAYKLLELMKERDFPVEEETYGPLLIYLIDMGMVEEFHFFCNIIKDDNSNSSSRLAYYQMLFWIGAKNEDKIKELCNQTITNDGRDWSSLQENYLLALFESDRQNELLLLLDSIDIRKVSSIDRIAHIFRSLGRLLLESIAMKFLQALKDHDIGAENISNFIYSYAIGMPNLVVGDVISKFKTLHAELEVEPSSEPYEKLIRYCCDSLKVHTALDMIDQILEAGLTISMEIFQSILNACDESCDYYLVDKIHALICRHNLKPNSETFRCMIDLKVKMRDYDGAYAIIKDVKNMNLMPTVDMYNTIMAGYFQERRYYGGLSVLKEMEEEDVKPDSHTFSHLIKNCNCEEEIAKYYDELKESGVQVTNHIYMALINAYAACGHFEKAKQVVFDEGVPVENLNEIKSVLVTALAAHGKMPDALEIYEEIKQAHCSLKPKAIISLIEHLLDEGELNRLLQLLEELKDPEYWVDGCYRVILYCVRHKHLSSAVDLLKQLSIRFYDDEVAREFLFDEMFCQIAEAESVELQIGLYLLQAIKEELGLHPSRISLDFLLTACARANDSQNCFKIWQEYEMAGLPYNVLSFLRMYQALLNAGDAETAGNMLRNIRTDDPHVRCVIQESQRAYGTEECISKASPED